MFPCHSLRWMLSIMTVTSVRHHRKEKQGVWLTIKNSLSKWTDQVVLALSLLNVRVTLKKDLFSIPMGQISSGPQVLNAALLMSKDNRRKWQAKPRKISATVALGHSLSLWIWWSSFLLQCLSQLRGSCRVGREGGREIHPWGQSRALELIKKIDQWRNKDNLVLSNFLNRPSLGNSNSLPHCWNN